MNNLVFTSIQQCMNIHSVFIYVRSDLKNLRKFKEDDVHWEINGKRIRLYTNMLLLFFFIKLSTNCTHPIHIIRDVLCEPRLLRVSPVAHPHIHDAALLLPIKRHPQDVAELRVEHAGVWLDLHAARSDRAPVSAHLEELHWRALALWPDVTTLP